jgi:hypothetical protein
LSISAYLSLQAGGEEEDPERKKLLAKGWVVADSIPCEKLEARKFYEVDSESGATELYVMEDGNLLFPPPHQWPEPPATCRPIPKPSFIQEIP